MRRIAVLFIVSILLTATVTVGLNAQPDDLEPILTYVGLVAYKWSTDGQSFVFANGPESARLNIRQGVWYQYDVDTGQLTETPSWPLQPALTNREREILRIFPDSFIFESPGKNYLAYVSELNPERLNSLAVAKLSTLSPANFDDIYIYTPIGVGSEFDVQWNTDSSSFVVSQPFPYGGYQSHFHYFVSGFEANITKATRIFIPYTFGDRSFDLQVFDLSEDGELVLLYGLEIEDDSRTYAEWETKFLIWDAADPEALLILDDLAVENVLHGRFVPGSDNGQLLFVDVDGISAYDIAANQKTVLYPEINATRYQQAWFSPDSSHLAFTRQTNQTEVFVVALSDYIVMPTSTIPTQTATVTP